MRQRNHRRGGRGGARLWSPLAVSALLLAGLPMSSASPAQAAVDRALAPAAIAPAAIAPAAATPSAATAGGDRPAIGRDDTWYLRDTLTTGTADSVFAYGSSTDAKVVGDWNGDGTSTPGAVRGSVWTLRNSNESGTAEITFNYGRSTDVPIVGDWNGDGIVTPGVVRGRTWHLRNSTTPGPADVSFAYGRSTDVPVVGDWDGDGITTPGVVRGRSWYLRNSTTPGPAELAFGYGRATDAKVAGDWDGNGTDTIGVFRDGRWFLRNVNSAGPTALTFSYGRAGDLPLVWHEVDTTVPASLIGAEWGRLPTSRPVVALTFDAGSNDDGVASILATLRAEGVPGTFFLTGGWVDRHPEVAREIAVHHPVANHSQTHPYFTALSDSEIDAEIGAAATRIAAATGQDPRPLFRFPYGDRDARTIGVVNDNGYGSIRWTVDTRGWQGTSGGQSMRTVTDRVLAAAQPGEIVLMHVGSHPTDGSTLDADALPGMIRELRARGYTFTTVRALT